MTREDILAMEPGRELDALVAEKVMGWRKIHGPKTDYDGPCESFDVLIPPSIDDPFPLYPPRGAIKPWLFCHNWSTDLSAAWEVEEKLSQHEGHIQLGYVSRLHEILDIPFNKPLTTGQVLKLLRVTPEQRCKAALMAVMNIW